MGKDLARTVANVPFNLKLYYMMADKNTNVGQSSCFPLVPGVILIKTLSQATPKSRTVE